MEADSLIVTPRLEGVHNERKQKQFSVRGQTYFSNFLVSATLFCTARTYVNIFHKETIEPLKKSQKEFSGCQTQNGHGGPSVNNREFLLILCHPFSTTRSFSVGKGEVKTLGTKKIVLVAISEESGVCIDGYISHIELGGVVFQNVVCIELVQSPKGFFNPESNLTVHRAEIVKWVCGPIVGGHDSQKDARQGKKILSTVLGDLGTDMGGALPRAHQAKSIRVVINQQSYCGHEEGSGKDGTIPKCEKHNFGHVGVPSRCGPR
jgi:hypothetical protein